MKHTSMKGSFLFIALLALIVFIPAASALTITSSDNASNFNNSINMTAGRKNGRWREI